MEQLVLDNRIDLGLIETQPEHEELVAVPFSGTELQAIVPPDSPLAGRGKVTIQELAQFPFLMREPGSAGRKALDGYLALHRLSVQPAWESVSTQALIKAVVEGLGVAVLPKLLIQQDVASGNVVPAYAERAAAANSEYCLPQAEIPLRKYAALHRAVPGDGGTVNDTVHSR